MEEKAGTIAESIYRNEENGYTVAVMETEEEYLAFKKLGVEFIQGYYFSKPLPKDRVLNYIQEWL